MKCALRYTQAMSAPLYADADRWMDRDDSPAGGRTVRGLIAPAMALPKRFLNFISTTPGILTIISFLLVAAILAAGGAMALSSTWRQNDLNTLVSRTEPLSNAAQELFNSLSVADSAATTEFLETKEQNSTQSQSYDRHIANASQEIIKASAGIDNVDSREMELVLQLQTDLPRYVELVSEASANDRFRNPVGVSYLTQASHLMQRTMLPAAEELYTITSKQVSEQQRHVISPMWFPLSGLIAAAVLLIIAQLWLSANTNRVFNIGYLIATMLMVIALLVASISAGWTWKAGTNWIQSSMGPLETLTQQRIAAQQARTGEALGLVQRSYGDDNQEEFSRTIARIDNELEAIRDSVVSPHRIVLAREHLQKWDAAHAVMVYELQHGNFKAASAAALGSPSDDDQQAVVANSNRSPKDVRLDLRTSYTLFDEELQELISESREQLRDVLTAGQSAAQRTATIVAIMTAVAAIATLAGTRPRVREYL